MRRLPTRTARTTGPAAPGTAGSASRRRRWVRRRVPYLGASDRDSPAGNLGDYAGALDLLRDAGGVLSEGPFGQAHRVYGDNNTEMVRPPRKGGDQAYLATCGVTLASAVIRTLFGFDPPVEGAADPAALLRDARTPRGFDGVLRRVPYRGALFDITSRKDRGLEIAPSA